MTALSEFRVHSIRGVRFGRKFAGAPSVQLDGLIRELRPSKHLYARTDTGWWRIRSGLGFCLAHRVRRPK